MSADHQREHPGQRDRGPRVAAGASSGHDRGEDQRRHRRVGPEHEHARRAEDRVPDEARDRRVQAGDRGQPRQLGVRHPLRHEDRRQHQPRDEVGAQPRRRYARSTPTPGTCCRTLESRPASSPTVIRAPPPPPDDAPWRAARASPVPHEAARARRPCQAGETRPAAASVPTATGTLDSRTPLRSTLRHCERKPRVRDVLRGGGDVGRDMLAVDWAATPLGPPEGWPQSLRTAVRIVLTLALLDVDGLGPGADVLLQRRVPRATRSAPSTRGRSAGRPRGVGRDLARHRPAHRRGAGDRRRHLGRGAAAVPRAQRLPRGDLPHVLLQPAAPTTTAASPGCCASSARTPSGSSASGGWRPCATWAAIGRAATPSAETVAAAGASSRHNSLRPAVRAGLPVRRRRGDRAAGRRDRHRRRTTRRRRPSLDRGMPRSGRCRHAPGVLAGRASTGGRRAADRRVAAPAEPARRRRRSRRARRRTASWSRA